MKKLSTILLTILFMGITFTSSFASCQSIHRENLTSGQIVLNYINYGGNTGSVSSNTGSVLTPSNVESLTQLTHSFTSSFSGDYLVLTETIEFLATGDSSNNNPNLPNVNSINSPLIFLSSDSTKMSYCEIIGISDISNSNNYIGEYNSSSTNLTPKLSSFNITLKCYKHEDFPASSSGYKLTYNLNFNLFYNDSYTLNTQYRVSAQLRNYAISFQNTCTNEQIIETLDSVNDSIIDLNDSITDTNISNSVTELEDQLEEWSVNNHGLSAFVTAPLSFISSLAQQDTCTPISLPALLGNSSTFVLPCIMEEFEDKFPTLFAIYQIAIYFFVCYRIGIDLFRTVHKLKDPLNDEISVADI